MKSQASTVDEYLATLPDDRREALSAIRQVILENLDSQLEEGMQHGMIGYCVPHHVYPAGYHCDPRQPLPYAGLASQKNHMALYLMGCHMDAEQTRWFQQAWTRAGHKLDMGKSCVRFKKLADVPLAVIGEIVRRIPARKYIANYESALAMTKSRPRKSATPAKKKTATKKKPAAANKAVKKKGARKSSR